MILDRQKLFYNMLFRGLKEAHLETVVDFRFILEENIPAELKNAVKEAAKAKYLDDADMVLVFRVKVDQAQAQGNPEGGQEGENSAPTATGSDETTVKNTVVKTIERCFYLGDTDETKVETVDIEPTGGKATLVKFTFPE